MRTMLSLALLLLVAQPAAAAWTQLSTTGSPTARHECAFVELNGRFYLLCGRRVNPVDVFDPATQAWSVNDPTPIELHHFQAVVHEGLVYLMGAMTGSWPGEPPIESILIYDPGKDRWIEGPQFPADRRRGGAGAVLHGGEIWLVGGQLVGHTSGTKGWVDRFDPLTGQWTALPADMPHPRDHVQVAILDGKLYAAGGRVSTTTNNFGGTVRAVDVLDLGTLQWTTLADSLPTERAGAPAGVVGGQLLVCGGESTAQVAAHAQVEAFDPVGASWSSLPSLVTGRHGTQAIPYAGQLYVAAGSGNRGGSPELNSIEGYASGSYSAPAPVEHHELLAELLQPTGLPAPQARVAGAVDAVVDLVLVDADRDIDLFAMSDGDTLDLTTLPTPRLNIRAVTSPGTVGSVVFDYDGQLGYKTETAPPYALAGDSGGDFAAWTPSLGDHTVTATPYSGSGGSGTPGTPLTLGFTVVQSPPPPELALDFGDVVVGQSALLGVRLCHPGGGAPPLTVRHVQVVGRDMGAFSTSVGGEASLPVVLAAGDSLDVHVSFAPADTVEYGVGQAQFGSLCAAALSVNYEGGPSALTVPLRGQGVVAATAAPQPARSSLSLRISSNPGPAPAISFELPRRASALAEVFTLRGERVITLFSGELAAGPHHLLWDGRDDSGRWMPRGSYLVRVRAGGHVESGKLLLLR